MVNTSNAEYYRWGEGCEGWHLLNTQDLSVIREKMPAGTSDQRHFHTKSRQFFYVLTGTLAVEIGGRREVLAAHQGIEVPAGIHHRVSNETGSAVEFIVVSQPHSHGDRVAEIPSS